MTRSRRTFTAQENAAVVNRNLVQYTDRNGRVIVYEYDNLQRRTAEKWMDGASVLETISYTFDVGSQLTSVSSTAADYTYSYDNLGNVISTLYDLSLLGVDVVLDQTYDALDRRTSLAAEIDGTADFINSYSYDFLNRMTQITQSGQSGGNAVADKRVDFTYDAEDKLQFTSFLRYADLAGTDLIASTQFGYDATDRLTGITHNDGDATQIAGYTIGWDQGNRLTDFSVYGFSAEDATYSYDDTDQLTGADRSGTANDEAYTYDENGNRINTGYSTGDNNQLLSDGTYNYGYDDEGNRVLRTNIADNSYTVYEYDYRNRLVSVVDYNASDVKLQKVQYSYDASNLLIARQIDSDGDGIFDVSGSFIYDGYQIVLELDDTAAVEQRLLWGPNVDQILADETDSGDVHWALTDHLNTVRDWAQYNDATDTTSIVNHIAYDVYGNILSETTPSLDAIDLYYTARYFDDATGLQYNSNRWYDPATGKWMSIDPIGFEAEDANLYRYVGNGPANATDSSGLKKDIVIEIHVYLPTIAPNGIPKAVTDEVERLLKDANIRGGGDPTNTITVKWEILGSVDAYDKTPDGAKGFPFANGSANFSVCEDDRLKNLGTGHVASGNNFTAKISPTKFNAEWSKVLVPQSQLPIKKEVVLAGVIVHELFYHGIIWGTIDLANAHTSKSGFIDSEKPSLGGTNTLSKETCERIVQRFSWD